MPLQFAHLPAPLPAPLPAVAAGRHGASEPAPHLSVDLGHMGVRLAIAGTPQGERGDDRSTLRIPVTPATFDRCLGMFTGESPADLDLDHDPVVRRLSRALHEVEHGQARPGADFGGLYADALRLAIVARLVGAHPLAEIAPSRTDAMEARVETAEEIPAATPDDLPRQRRRPKSGLPKWRFKRVVAYVEENLGTNVTLADMANAAGLSRMHFAAQFRVLTGLRPHEYLLRQRIERAQHLLVTTRDPLVEIALAVGFQTQAHFTTVFRRFVGDTPYQWRSANRPRG